MKHIIVLLLSIITLPSCLMAQGANWPVLAVDQSGETFPVYVYLADDTAIPLSAIYEAGNDHFMDVKAVHKGERISIKLIASEDMLVPVKGITKNGKILKVKAKGVDGKILDVKGISRDGNTINIAAINENGSFMPLKTISPTGVERAVKGVRFLRGSVEMEFGDIKVIGHVKALPIIDVGDIDKKWEITARTTNGATLSLFAISEKGKEFPIKANMPSEHPYIMDVRAESSIDIFVKLIKNDHGVVLSSIDEYGRLYKVEARAENGESFIVIGGELKGNVIPIFVKGAAGQKFPVIAISSEGHEFDVKGIKVKEDEIEGRISGLNVWVSYYAHVKALASAHEREE